VPDYLRPTYADEPAAPLDRPTGLPGRPG
jgi:hypothetical protein